LYSIIFCVGQIKWIGEKKTFPQMLTVRVQREQMIKIMIKWYLHEGKHKRV